MNSTLFDERIACPTCGMHLPTLSRLHEHTAASHPSPRVLVIDDEHTIIDLRDGLVRLRRF